MPRLKLTLAYDGTRFCGWQLQAGSQDRTVQGCLEEALARICNAPVRVHGAGRTDSGVHALGQVAHCDIPDQRVDTPWQKALNALLPEDVCVVDAGLVPSDFHARFGATSKRYTYSLWPNRRYSIPQRRYFTWTPGPLDLEAMDNAAALLLGEHDFASFQNTGTPVKSTVRTLTRASRGPGLFPGEVLWTFEANGFLKQMVRNLVGLLVQVGLGRKSPADVSAILDARDRNVAYPTAPPQGLCLEQVFYSTD